MKQILQLSNRIEVTFIKLMLLLLILINPMTSAAQNLILNPDCELPLVTARIQHWTEVVGTKWSLRAGNPSPQSGSNYFFAGAAANAELAQDIDVSANASNIDNNIQLSLKFRGALTFTNNIVVSCSTSSLFVRNIKQSSHVGIRQ